MRNAVQTKFLDYGSLVLENGYRTQRRHAAIFGKPPQRPDSRLARPGHALKNKSVVTSFKLGSVPQSCSDT
jgi:hypothetical protein